MGWGVGGAGKEGKWKGEGEGAGGGRWRGEMRYELKLRRMENEWGWEELDWVQAPFHTEAQWRNPEGSAEVEVPQKSPACFTWARAGAQLCS